MPFVAVSHHEKIDFAKNNAQLKEATPAALMAFPPAYEAYKAASDHLSYREGWGYAFAIHDDVKAAACSKMLKRRDTYTAKEVFRIRDHWLTLDDAEVYETLQNAFAAQSADEWFQQIEPALHLSFAKLCAEAKPKKQPTLRTSTYEYFFIAVKIFAQELQDLIEVASPACVRSAHWYPKFWTKDPNIRTMVSSVWNVLRATPSVDLHVEWLLEQEEFKPDAMRTTGNLDDFFKSLLAKQEDVLVRCLDAYTVHETVLGVTKRPFFHSAQDKAAELPPINARIKLH